MKSLLENKLHQTPSNAIFVFFSIFFEIMVHLKCIKHFIKHASLTMFDEVFDAFTPALTHDTKDLPPEKYLPLFMIGSLVKDVKQNLRHRTFHKKTKLFVMAP